MYRHPLGEPLAGTRRTDWYLTHADGTVLFESVVRVQEAEMRLQAYEFDEAGRTVWTLAANQAELRGMVDGSPPMQTALGGRSCSRRGGWTCMGCSIRVTSINWKHCNCWTRPAAMSAFSNVYARKGVAAVFMEPGTGSGEAMAACGNCWPRAATWAIAWFF